jgi:hypothetical protein
MRATLAQQMEIQAALLQGLAVWDAKEAQRMLDDLQAELPCNESESDPTSAPPSKL